MSSTLAALLALVATAAALLSLAWAIILSRRLDSWSQRYAVLTQGVDGTALETLLRRYIEVAESSKHELERLDSAQRALDRQLQSSVQGVGLVHFDAFEDSGGRQSFALALLDPTGNGAVLSAVYHRDVCRVYARPVVGGGAPAGVQIGTEEQQAIRVAKGGPAG